MARQNPYWVTLGPSRRGPRDRGRGCDHRPDQWYTREPCSCGRPLWPPRGRGRGESQLSPRRIQAKLRAVEAMRLSSAGYTYTSIARLLGYRDASGAWRAIHRALAGVIVEERESSARRQR